MFSKFERSAVSGERGNAAVVALCVTTLAVGVVMGVRLLRGSGSSKPATPIAATNIGSGASDADPTGASRASSGPISSAVSGSDVSAGASAGVAAGVAASPVPTLAGSVPTVPPDGAVPVAAPIPVVAVTPTTTPPVILGLKTPQAASRNLFDAWKENDRARALRFAFAEAVDVVFRFPWGAEVQDDGCSETSNPTSFHCAFVGDEVALIVVVDQRIGPTGREFVPIRTIRTGAKNTSGLPYAPPTAEAVDPAVGPSAPGPTTTIDPLAGDEPLVDPAGTLDLTDPAIVDPSLLDPAGAAAALAEPTGDSSSVDAGPGSGAVSGGGASGSGSSSGAKASVGSKAKPPKKKKSTVRRPKSAVSSSKSAASTDAGSGTSAGSSESTKPAKTATSDQLGASGSSGAAEPAAPTGGAVKAGAPPVNQVDG